MTRLYHKQGFVLAAMSLQFIVASGCGPTASPPELTASPPELTAPQPSTAENGAELSLVGREVCGECHRENFLQHGQSGHSSTLALTDNNDIVRHFVGKQVDAGEPYGIYEYTQGAGGLEVSRPQADDRRNNPLTFAIGSGHNAVTLFSLHETGDDDSQRETVGLEHRVSWYPALKELGLTPGHAEKYPNTPLEYYGDVVREKLAQRCIDCHSTAGTIVGSEIANLVANVNCEKCHGPGSEHVRQARLSTKPPPFSVGRKEWDNESQLQLCGSCHRLPQDFDPKQLREYPTLMARFQPVGMLRSKCYLESNEGMACTTCHNPHQASSDKPKAEYIQDCVNCHQAEDPSHVVCPVSPRDGCVECHMPPLKFEQGMTFHDHWIRIRR